MSVGGEHGGLRLQEHGEERGKGDWGFGHLGGNVASEGLPGEECQECLPAAADYLKYGTRLGGQINFPQEVMPREEDVLSSPAFIATGRGSTVSMNV